MTKDDQLIEFLNRLKDCEDYKSSWQLYTQAVSKLGFTQNAYVFIPNEQDEIGTGIALSNYDPGFISTYIEFGGLQSDDTVQWSQLTGNICHWSNPAHRFLHSNHYTPLEELSKDFNVCNGVTIPMKTRYKKSCGTIGLSATDSSRQEYEHDVIQHLDLTIALTHILEMHLHQFEPHQMLECINQSDLHTLHPLEQETILWLSNGYSIKEVADKKMFKSVESINLYIKKAKIKLQVRSRDQLIARAILLGLV